MFKLFCFKFSVISDFYIILEKKFFLNFRKKKLKKNFEKFKIHNFL